MSIMSILAGNPARLHMRSHVQGLLEPRFQQVELIDQAEWTGTHCLSP